VKAFWKFSTWLLLFSLFLLLLSQNVSAASFLNSRVLVYLRIFLARLFSVFRFSVFELLVIISPFFIIISFIRIVRTGRARSVISVLLIFASLYILNIGIGINSKSALSSGCEVSYEEIIDCAEKILPRLNGSNGDFEKSGEREVVYEKIRVKELAASPILMRGRIFGLYSFISSEPCVNNILPDYIYYFTAFHEISHVIGYVKEGEASLFAYRTMRENGDEYLEFLAELYAYESILNEVYKSSKSDYQRLYNALYDYPKNMLLEYRKILKKYPQSKISDAVSEAYNNISGGGDYSDFVRLLVIENR
jgi:hypothetical protein